MEFVPIIKEVLTLLNKLVPDEAMEIAKKIKALEDQWDAEFSKQEKRDDNALDLIQSELRDIRELFSNAVTAASFKVKS
jgi:hypothetical protein